MHFARFIWHFRANGLAQLGLKGQINHRSSDLFLNFRNCPFLFRRDPLAGRAEIHSKKVHFARFIWHFRANGLALLDLKGQINHRSSDLRSLCVLCEPILPNKNLEHRIYLPHQSRYIFVKHTRKSRKKNANYCTCQIFILPLHRFLPD